MLKIWGRKTCPNVQKVMWTVAELGLLHERVDVGGVFGKTREPEYLAMNPNALVPTLQEDDFTLWESNAIVRYLAGRYGQGTLVPSDARTRARADQWMDWQVSVVGPAIGPAFHGLVRTPPEKRDPARIAASQQKTLAAMEILDRELAKSAYVAGDAFSMGDIALGSLAHRFRHLVPERPELPGFSRWYDELARRPAFQEHVAAIKLG